MNFLIGKIIYSTARLYNNCRSVFYEKKGLDKSISLNKKMYLSFNKNRPFGPLPKLCYAPWTNLFFNTHGKAIVCCKNTKVILGKYPEKKIHDMWFGPSRDLLKESINNNDLTFGCYKCKESITQGNYSSATSVFFDKYGMLPVRKYPRVIEFELSNMCNLECVMCSERVSSAIQVNREKKEKMRTPYDEDFVGQLDEFIPHLNEAKFTGGEPFLIPMYYKIWEKIEKINPSVKILIQTNGTILNNEIKKLNRRLHFRINVSIDSVNKSIYESIRKNANFENMINNVEWLGKNTRDLGVIATPFRMNWKDIPNIVLYCDTNQYHFNISPMYYPKDLALWSLDVDSLNEIINYYGSVRLPSGNWLEKQNQQVFNELIRSLEDWRDRKIDHQSFVEDIENYFSLQEREVKLDEKKIISKESLVQLRNNCQKKLMDAGLLIDELDELENLTKKIIEEKKAPLTVSSVYIKLDDIEPAEAVYTFRTATRDELYSKIKSLINMIEHEYNIEK